MTGPVGIPSTLNVGIQHWVPSSIAPREGLHTIVSQGTKLNLSFYVQAVISMRDKENYSINLGCFFSERGYNIHTMVLLIIACHLPLKYVKIRM